MFGETEVDVLQHTRKSFLIRPTKRWKTLSPEARTLITALLASEEEVRYENKLVLPPAMLSPAL